MIRKWKKAKVLYAIAAQMVKKGSRKKLGKMKKEIEDKAKKEGLEEEWIDCIFNLIFFHFLGTESFTFKCEDCLDFRSYFCKGGNFPDCFIEQAKAAKEGRI